MSVVVGIDIGTTSAKAAGFDVHGRERSAAEVGYPLLEPEPGAAVQDPDAVVDAALRATREAVAAARGAGLQIDALACSGAMHALAAVDARDRPTTPLLTWADRRAAAQAAWLRREHPDLHARTGTPLHPMSPLAKLLWLREHEPETFAAAARWVGVKELVVHRLAGAWLTDPSSASGTGLLRLDSQRWDPEALALAGIAEAQLCPLAPCTQVLGLRPEVAAALGVPVGTPLVLGAADGPLASVGVGAVRPGVAACSIGTSGALRLMVDRPAVDPRGRTFCFALEPGRWIVGGAISNGGIVLRWTGDALAPDLGPHSERALLRLAAEAPPGSDGLLMLPHLLDERAPEWTGRTCGAYVGLTRSHRRAHLVRAALEGVCQQLALVLDGLRDAGHRVDEVRATGGFARSALWRRMLCDVLDVPLAFPSADHGSALGAALVGMQALGAVDDLARAAELVPIGERLHPDPEAAAIYAAMRPAFAALPDALAPVRAGSMGG